MRDFARIVSRINNSVWLMSEEGIHAILDILERHMSEDEDEIRRHIALIDPGDASDRSSQIVDGVGVLNLEGPIFPKANLMTELSGATSLEMFRNEFRSMVQDDRVHSILLNVDSPGGVSDMVMETAAEIREARQIKPVISIANTMAASAAAWIASAGSESYITDSGLGGSIGVYTVHLDRTEAEKKLGIKKTVIKSGVAKAAHEEPLDEHTRQNLQNSVDDMFSDFVESVAAGRNLTTEQVMEFADGGILTPRKAVEVGLFDGVKTYDNLLAEMSENGGAVGNASTATVVHALARKGMKVSFNGIDLTGNNATYLFEPDKEHADPGTSGEPIPRESPMEGDPAVTGGWRVPGELQPSFPPVTDQPPPTSKGNRKGSAMDREQLVALANQLGIDHEGVEDTELFAAITSEISDVVTPLQEAGRAAEQRRSFATEFPEEYDRYQKLLQRDEENEARQFASRWERFEVEDNGSRKKLTSGFSARALGHIEGVALKLSRRQLQEEDIADLLDSVAVGGIVDYGETGSARSEGEKPNLQQLNIKQIRTKFADEVKRTMEEDGVDRRTATKLVGERDPELAEAYKTGHISR